MAWEHRRLDQYTWSLSGSEPGSTPWIKEVFGCADSLACIFLAIIPWSFFELIAKWTSKYAYDDWVVEVTGKDRDSNLKKKVHLERCIENTERCRHRADNEATKYKITPGFVLCWFALIILQSAHFESNNKDVLRIWKKASTGFQSSVCQKRNAGECILIYSLVHPVCWQFKSIKKRLARIRRPLQGQVCNDHTRDRYSQGLECR